MQSGSLNRIVVFQRSTVASDGGGGGAISWADHLTVWGELRVERGRERIDGGRLAEQVAGVLKVRSSIASRALTSADRVLIGNVPYQIRSITNPDQRDRFLEMVVERGSAT